eukprot:COSAG05_NODE_22108_length_267_cov_0.607143_2_plen_27_part_01
MIYLLTYGAGLIRYNSSFAELHDAATT